HRLARAQAGAVVGVGRPGAVAQQLVGLVPAQAGGAAGGPAPGRVVPVVGGGAARDLGRGQLVGVVVVIGRGRGAVDRLHEPIGEVVRVADAGPAGELVQAVVAVGGPILGGDLRVPVPAVGEAEDAGRAAQVAEVG